MSQNPPSSGGDKPEDPDRPAAAPPGEGFPPPDGAYGQPLPPYAYGQPLPPYAYGQPPPPGAYGQPLPPYGYGHPPPPGAYGQPLPPYGYGQPPPPGAYGQPLPPYGYGQPPPPGAYGQAPAPGGGYSRLPAPHGGYGQPAYRNEPYGRGYGSTPGERPYGWSGGAGYGPYGYLSNGPGSLAGYGSRVVAYILDALIVGIPVGVITVAGGLGRFGEYSLEAVAAFLYATLLIGGASAQTIGMRVMKISVADASNASSPVGYGKAAARTAVALLFNLILFIGPLLDLLWPLWDRMNQTLHDKAAGTIVIRR